ncbi:MAG: FAD-binding protein, partial [Bryobacteraceae bacterium]
HPAAHYAMGGVRTDLDGRTSLPRLFAAGEVAATWVHGANRLASNSLLEALVFGARAGRAMRDWAGAEIPRRSEPARVTFPSLTAEQLRAVAWEHCGIVRHGERLARACEILEEAPLLRAADPGRELFEIRNMHTVVWLIARCALARRESRGAHYRTDFPHKDPRFQKHSTVRKHHDVEFV